LIVESIFIKINKTICSAVAKRFFAITYLYLNVCLKLFFGSIKCSQTIKENKNNFPLKNYLD
jgi:hypothetical protein